MKTLVGVDREGTYRAAVDLCVRIQFPDQEWTFAHAVPPLPSYSPGLVPMPIPVADAMDSLREEGWKAVDQARHSMGVEKATGIVLSGNPAACLLTLADEQQADMIVAGAGQPRGGLLWMIGSVSRTLSYGAKQSLLVAKSVVEGSGPLHAIFATDHSEYAQRALEKLIAWGPKGFRRIDVLTAFIASEATAELVKDEVGAGFDYKDWVCEHSLKNANLAAARLEAISPERHVMVQEGNANDVIRDAMGTTGADLLIVGAQGHGFIDRLLVGSVSLHQMVAEPYPVLLIRLA